MNEKTYTIEELKQVINEKIVVYLDSRLEHSKLASVFDLCDYYGNYCYSLNCKTYSSTSNSKTVGGYTGAQLIKFSQIDFQETPVNLLEQLIIW